MHLATLDMMFPWGWTFLYIPLPMTNTTGESRRRHVNKVFDRTICVTQNTCFYLSYNLILEILG